MANPEIPHPDLATLPPLETCRVMVCNDDGIQSRGIEILLNAIRAFTDDVWLVAPEKNQSARSRAYSIARDVHVQRQAPRRFAVSGTPVDCAIVGLNGLIPGKRPDLVLSGVNEGTNLAEDIPASGTIGACLEAVDQGIPAIAFSQVGTYSTDRDGSWLAAETQLPDLLPGLVANIGPTVPMLNVNFPQIRHSDQWRGTKVTASGKRPGPVHLTRRAGAVEGAQVFHYDILRDDRADYPDCDIYYAMEGYTTVTPLVWSLTHHAALDRITLD